MDELHISADWSKEKPRQYWGPSRRLLGSIRCYQKNKQKRGISALFISKMAVFQHRFWSVITGADIPLTCQLGGGLLIPHPNGIVIHPNSMIGVKRGSDKPPVLEDHVDVGAGAKIIGSILIERDALIGANSVVVKNVSAGSIVAGIPAKVIGSTRN